MNPDTLTSLVAVGKDTAIVAAEAMLKDAATMRAKERDEQIALVMTWPKWRGWFKRKTPHTREEAIARVDAARWDSMTEDWRLAVWRLECGNETLAKRLKAAASLTTDGNIWLNLWEAEVVASWSKS